MKVLVTGGTGYLGPRLVRRLAEEGHEIFLVGRSGGAQTAAAVFVRADITSPPEMAAARKATGPVDLLVHLAAKVPRTPPEDRAGDMTRVNVAGTSSVLETFGDGLRHVVYGSTVEVYGLPGGTEPITEQQLPVPLSNYGASKLAGEYLCRIFCQRRDISCSMLRFSVMYGRPDPIARAIPRFISKARAGEPVEVYGGEELRDYLHVDDAAEAVICAVRAKRTGVYNIGSGKATSVRQAAEAVMEATGSAAELHILPRRKKRSDLVVAMSAAREELGYEPSRRFPSGLEAQLA